MDPRQYLIEALETKYGSVPKAAESLGIPYPTLAATCNGTRGCSPDLAVRLGNASGGFLDPARLVWIRPIPKGKRQSDQAA